MFIVSGRFDIIDSSKGMKIAEIDHSNNYLEELKVLAKKLYADGMDLSKIYVVDMNRMITIMPIMIMIGDVLDEK